MSLAYGAADICSRDALSCGVLCNENRETVLVFNHGNLRVDGIRIDPG